MKKKTARRISESKVYLVWKRSQECICEDEEVIRIHPEWLQDNGTPMCNCGNDYVYTHTEIEE